MDNPASPMDLGVEHSRLLHAGRVLPDASWAIAAHAHRHWEFIYFVRGTGRVDTPGATIHPQAYQLIIYPPGLSHAEASSPVDPEQTIHMGIDAPLAPVPGSHILLPDPEGELGWLAERIVREAERRGSTPLAQSHARSFLYLVERMWDIGVSVRHDTVDLAVQYLMAHYPEEITAESLADALHVSSSHLTHRFSAKVGTSPLRYLQSVRIEAARRLLITTDLPVGEIAARVGFTDPLYFSRVFNKNVGESPTVCRKKSNSAD